MPYAGVAENPWSDKVALLTWVPCTIGGEILNQIASREFRAIIGIDNNENHGLGKSLGVAWLER